MTAVPAAMSPYSQREFELNPVIGHRPARDVRHAPGTDTTVSVFREHGAVIPGDPCEFKSMEINEKNRNDFMILKD